jgi:hypothetical protein
MKSWMSNWKKRRDLNVGAELRAARPEPSARFVKAMAARINPHAVRPVRTRTRIGVAAVATACMAAVLGATGGFSFASSSVINATHSVTHLAVPRTSAPKPVPHTGPVGNAACTQYGSAPTIGGFTPTSGGAGNTTVSVSGTNFSGLSQVNSVSVGGKSASPTIVSSTQLTFTVPSDASLGTSKISVTNCKGTATSTGDFTVLAAPSISTVTPGDGGVGTPVVIAGTGFSGTGSVTVNGVSATFSTNDAGTEIDMTVPLKAPVGAGSIQVTNAAGSDSADFTVDSGAPTVASFTPTSGAAGTSVKITGKGFFEGGSSAPDTSDISVQFGSGGSAEPASIDKDTQLTVLVPADAATGPITVQTQLGGATSKTSFTFFGSPTISGFTPGFGKVGSKVVISGSSFTGATAVDFGSSDPSAQATGSKISVKDGSISATVPTGALTGTITVETPRGNATSADDFTVIATPPNPTGVSPNHGGYTANVTITGDTLAGVTAITFNGKPQKAFTIVDDTEIDTTVPLGAPIGPGSGSKAGIVLTNGKGSMSIAFTVDNTAPAIAKVTSDVAGKKAITSGKPGDTIYLNGTHLGSVDSVDIGDGTVTSFVSQSATQIQLLIPTGDTTTTAPITANDSTTDTSGSSGNFTVYQAPMVVGIPAFGAAGKKIQITGTNFAGAKTVSFIPDGGGTTVTSPSGNPGKDGSLSVSAPSGAKGVVVGKSYSVSVTLADGLSGNSGGAEVLIVAMPKITSLVQHGDSVELDGSGFTGVDGGGSNGLVIGKTSIGSFTIVSDGKITFTLTGTEPSGTITATNAAGKSAPSKTPIVGGPTVTSGALKSVASQSVTIKGTGLVGTDGNATVTINGTGVTFTPGHTQTQTSIVVVASGLTLHQIVTIVVTTNVGTVTKTNVKL